MKKTNKEFMEWLGISAGDTIIADNIQYTIKEDRGIFWYSKLNEYYTLTSLLDRDFDILPKPKRVGDLRCGECSCTTCQLRGIGCRNVSTNTKNTLYEILDKYFEEYPDQEIYDLIKARLDKVVE